MWIALSRSMIAPPSCQLVDFVGDVLDTLELSGASAGCSGRVLLLQHSGIFGRPETRGATAARDGVALEPPKNW